MVVTTAVLSSSRLSWPFIAWLIREMTSAPKGAWPLRVERTAAAIPVRRFINVPTSVVVPTSNATPKHSSVVSPGSTATSCSPASTAVTLKPPFRSQRVSLSGDVAPLVVEVRLGELQVDLADVGVDDDQPAEPHRRRLRHAQQLRHLARDVLVDARLARQPPAVVDLVLAKQPVIGGGHFAGAFDHPDLALATGPTPAARRVDGESDPVRGAEQRGAGRHARGPVEGLVRHLELALDHVDDACASSAL